MKKGISYYMDKMNIFKKPKWWFRDRVITRILAPILYRSNNGIQVCKEEWDYLIVLDACRYDLFKDNYKELKIDGELEYRISRGGNTPEWIQENFQDNKNEEIVYISGNPFVYQLARNNFFEMVNAWDFGWNEKFRTVLPETMTKIALDTCKKNPDKRIIIHFMQPHGPFISDIDFFNDFCRKWLEKKGNRKLPTDYTKCNAWFFVSKGLIEKNKVIDAYRNNFKILIPHIQRLVNELDGKIVITSDHGEALGEKIHSWLPIKIWGHYRGIRIPGLIKVPFFIVDRKKKVIDNKIRKDKVTTSDDDNDLNNEKIKSRLEDLGYL